MGKDFRIGLVLGLMLAMVALVWVATRPSLRPQARAARSQDFGFQIADFESNEGGRTAPQAAKGPQTSANVSGDSPGASRGSATDQSLHNEADAAQPQNAERRKTEAAASVNPQSPDANPQSTLPNLTIYERDEKIKTTRFHIVRRGETLSVISRQYYGSPNGWRKILAANQETIKNPDRITPGTKLIIPE